MCLAEGTPSADGTQAFSRVGHSRGDFQPFTSFWQPDPASCSVHQPANAKYHQPARACPTSSSGLHKLHAQDSRLIARCQALMQKYPGEDISAKDNDHVNSSVNDSQCHGV